MSHEHLITGKNALILAATLAGALAMMLYGPRLLSWAIVSLHGLF